MSIIGDNIKALRKMYGHDGEDLTQQDIADIAGVARETVNKWESGAIGNIRDSNIQRLRDHFGLTVDDLRSESNGLSVKLSNHGVASRRVKATSSGEASVPVLSIGKVHAGSISDEESISTTVEVPNDVLCRHPKSFVLTVEGSCMNRVVPEGFHILVDPDLEPRNGSIVVAETKEYRAVLRRWYKFQSMLVLEADSYDTYDDIILREDDGPVRVVGTVVWVQSAREMD